MGRETAPSMRLNLHSKRWTYWFPPGIALPPNSGPPRRAGAGSTMTVTILDFADTKRGYNLGSCRESESANRPLVYALAIILLVNEIR